MKYGIVQSNAHSTVLLLQVLEIPIFYFMIPPELQKVYFIICIEINHFFSFYG